MVGWTLKASMVKFKELPSMWLEKLRKITKSF
jgi:hypothetical protein